MKIKNGGILNEAEEYVVKIPGCRIQVLPILTFEDRIDIRELISEFKFDFLTLPNV